MAPACCGTAARSQQRLAVAHLARVRAAAAPPAHSAAPACPARPASLGIAASPTRPAGRATRAMVSRVTPPSRRITGASPVTSTTVNSSPIGGRPAVQDHGDAVAEVGLHVRRRASGSHGRSGWRSAPRPAGRRRAGEPARGDARARARAMVSRPAVARSATGQSGCLAITRVSGPGQNAAASRRPLSVRRPSRAAARSPRRARSAD